MSAAFSARSVAASPLEQQQQQQQQEADSKHGGKAAVMPEATKARMYVSMTIMSTKILSNTNHAPMLLRTSMHCNHVLNARKRTTTSNEK